LVLIYYYVISPFGTRCTSIHDPRTKANDPKHQFWLPHCVLETKNLATDMHIDWFKNYSFMDIHYGHTFGIESDSTTFHAGSGASGGKNKNNEQKQMILKLEDTVMNSFHEFYNAVIQRNATTTPYGATDSVVTVISHYNHKKIVSESKQNSTIVAGTTDTISNNKKLLTEAQRIEIELAMRTVSSSSNNVFVYNPIDSKGDTHSDINSTIETDMNISTALYKYKPSHIIFNEMCMILQTRAFDIICDGRKNINEHYDNENTVREIDVSMYNRNNLNHVLVHDIAFGLPGSNNSGVVVNGMTNENNRPRALWFNIQPEDIHLCTLQERMNYKRTCKKLEKMKKMQEMRNDSARVYLNRHLTFDISEEAYQNGFAEKPIIMNLPMDHDSFDLTNAVLKHRLSILKRSNQLDVDEELLRIEKKFNSLKSHLQKFCFWPVNDGREIVDDKTLVPEADDTYSVPIVRTKDEFTFHGKIWDSFVDCVSLYMTFQIIG
jgi:hypothetical protein